MTRSTLPATLTVLALVSTGPATAGAQTLVVQVDNDAGIPAADLARVEHVVARSFRAIGVSMIWEDGEDAPDDPRGLRVHLRLLSRTSAERKIAQERIGRAVLGQANRPARIVYIFSHRVVEASRKFAHDYTQMLGLVVAHELGHVLLPPGSHSDAGVMTGGVNFWGKMAHGFTPEEGELIRAILRRESRAGSDITRPANMNFEREHRTEREHEPSSENREVCTTGSQTASATSSIRRSGMISLTFFSFAFTSLYSIVAWRTAFAL